MTYDLVINEAEQELWRDLHDYEQLAKQENNYPDRKVAILYLRLKNRTDKFNGPKIKSTRTRFGMVDAIDKYMHEMHYTGYQISKLYLQDIIDRIDKEYSDLNVHEVRGALTRILSIQLKTEKFLDNLFEGNNPMHLINNSKHIGRKNPLAIDKMISIGEAEMWKDLFAYKQLAEQGLAYPDRKVAALYLRLKNRIAAELDIDPWLRITPFPSVKTRLDMVTVIDEYMHHWHMGMTQSYFRNAITSILKDKKPISMDEWEPGVTIWETYPTLTSEDKRQISGIILDGEKARGFLDDLFSKRGANPVHRVKNGWQWGKHGKVYPPTPAGKKAAIKQGIAVHMSGWHEPGKKSRKNPIKKQPIVLIGGLILLFYLIVKNREV